MRLALSLLVLLTLAIGCGSKKDDAPAATPPTPPKAPPAALTAYQDSLFKMRADLKVGISDDAYTGNLRTLQFQLDKASADPEIKKQPLKSLTVLKSAHREYLVAFECKKKISHPETLPEYPGDVAAMEAEMRELSAWMEAKGSEDPSRQRAKSLQQSLKSSDQTVDVVQRVIQLEPVLRAAKAKQPAFEVALTQLKVQYQQAIAKADSILSNIPSD